MPRYRCRCVGGSRPDARNSANCAIMLHVTLGVKSFNRMDFLTNPRRNAHTTFAGFVFQVNVTALRWQNLKPGQHLELEACEDIDLIQKVARTI